MMKWVLALVLMLGCAPAWAQQANTKSDCGASAGYHPGEGKPLSQDADGNLCVKGTLSVVQSALTPAALTFATTIPTTSGGTSIFTGGVASHSLTIYNNSTGVGAPTLWCNPSGGSASVGSGASIQPYGGGYLWASGLTTVPKCISDGGAATTTAATISGFGG